VALATLLVLSSRRRRPVPVRRQKMGDAPTNNQGGKREVVALQTLENLCSSAAETQATHSTPATQRHPAHTTPHPRRNAAATKRTRKETQPHTDSNHHNAPAQKRRRITAHPQGNAATPSQRPLQRTLAETRVAFSSQATANATQRSHTPPRRIHKKPSKV
jgi:hypothetical protein